MLRTFQICQRGLRIDRPFVIIANSIIFPSSRNSERSPCCPILAQREIEISCLLFQLSISIFRFYITCHIIISLKIVVFCIEIGNTVTYTPIIGQTMFLVCINRVTVNTLAAGQVYAFSLLSVSCVNIVWLLSEVNRV